MQEKLVGVLVALLLVIVVTALAPTIHTNTNTEFNSTGGYSGAGALVNVSTTAKPIYQLVDLLWAFLPIAIVLGAVYIMFKNKN